MNDVRLVFGRQAGTFHNAADHLVLIVERIDRSILGLDERRFKVIIVHCRCHLAHRAADQ